MGNRKTLLTPINLYLMNEQQMIDTHFDNYCFSKYFPCFMNWQCLLAKGIESLSQTLIS